MWMQRRLRLQYGVDWIWNVQRMYRCSDIGTNYSSNRSTYQDTNCGTDIGTNYSSNRSTYRETDS
jgi:hypothetical protein